MESGDEHFEEGGDGHEADHFAVAGLDDIGEHGGRDVGVGQEHGIVVALGKDVLQIVERAEDGQILGRLRAKFVPLTGTAPVTISSRKSPLRERRQSVSVSLVHPMTRSRSCTWKSSPCFWIQRLKTTRHPARTKNPSTPASTTKARETDGSILKKRLKSR